MSRIACAVASLAVAATSCSMPPREQTRSVGREHGEPSPPAVSPPPEPAQRRATRVAEHRREPAPDSHVRAARAPRPAPAPAPPPAPEPPPLPLEIVDVRVEQPSATTARVLWTTNLPASSYGARGLGDTPAVFTEAQTAALEHETVFAGLEPLSTYRLWLTAQDAWHRVETATLNLTTGLHEERPFARTDGRRVLVDGRPFFPRMVWAQCAYGVAAKLALGINLFMGDSCSPGEELVAAAQGRAFAVLGARADTAGILGWHHPDEWDEHLPAAIEPSQLREHAPEPPAGLLSFLTLTHHFYSRAEPLPQGRGLYPTLVDLADVVGFDLYPLQVWCRRDSFADVYESQRELVELAARKPTFQWIEAATMQCPGDDLAPSPETVRAEAWLAIAGGAAGIGYFPNHWADDVGAEIRRTNRQIADLTPALLAAPVDASSEAPAVKVAARMLAGALYVVAVNATRSPVEAAIRVPGLAGRRVLVFEEEREVVPTHAGDVLHDAFGPLAVHLYVAAPLLD